MHLIIYLIIIAAGGGVGGWWAGINGEPFWKFIYITGPIWVVATIIYLMTTNK